MAAPHHPPKVATADSGFAAVVAQVEDAAAQVAATEAQLVFGPWRAYATAVGQSGPANVNRATRAIRAIRGSNR